MKDLVLAYREKTGCRQYVFDRLSDAVIYFNKKCYDGEVILCIVYGKDNRESYRCLFTANDVLIN